METVIRPTVVASGSLVRSLKAFVSVWWLVMSLTVPDAVVGQTAGALDTTFNKGAGADGFVRVVAVQRDGKVLLGGNFATVRGVNNALIARLNSDGSSDAEFSSQFLTPVLQSRIYTVGLQTNGSILAAGLFTGVGTLFRKN